MAKVVQPTGGTHGEVTPPGPLKASHDFSDFDCGNEALNDWLKRRAPESEGKTARTYVVCSDNAVMGYYCLASGSVERSALPKSLRKHGLPNQVPIIIIGRLARDIRFKGTGLGQDLLQDALSRILAASKTIGIRCVLVHAIDEKAAKFWGDNEFIESTVGSWSFYLPIETIIDALD